MATIGCLGDVLFQVSSQTVKTLNNMKWSGSSRYVTHQRHGMNALTEFVGVDPDKITFEIYLSAELGTDPMSEVAKIWAYERNGQAVSLVIGDKAYGKYRWSILNHSITVQTFDCRGNIISAKVNVSLQEYLRS